MVSLPQYPWPTLARQRLRPKFEEAFGNIASGIRVRIELLGPGVFNIIRVPALPDCTIELANIATIAWDTNW
jgi:hypothetical protein